MQKNICEEFKPLTRLNPEKWIYAMFLDGIILFFCSHLYTISRMVWHGICDWRTNVGWPSPLTLIGREGGVAYPNREGRWSHPPL